MLVIMAVYPRAHSPIKDIALVQECLRYKIDVSPEGRIQMKKYVNSGMRHWNSDHWNQATGVKTHLNKHFQIYSYKY